MPSRRPVVLLLALSLAGCGGARASSAGEFAGDRRPVAQVVDDLAEAAGQRDGAAVCSRILARSLVDAMAARGAGCVAEVEAALGDADDATLAVRRVDVRGTRATAVVADGRDRERTIALVRERAGWRIARL